jgi:hypothetical protein
MRSSLLAAAWLGATFFSAAAVAQPDAPRTDQVRVVYGQPKEGRHQSIYQAVKDRGVLEIVRSLLSPLRLRRRLTIEIRGCDGTVDAYYENDVATLCYEYIELIQRHAPNVGTPGGVVRTDAIFGAIIDTLLHEAGHGVFDIMQTPIFGREEDAADFFSAYIMLRSASEDAQRLFEGVVFMFASEARAALERPYDAAAYAGEHGLAPQRYYNLLCMAYGSNPKIFGKAALNGGLPKKRADGCTEEFERLEQAFEKLIRPHVDKAVLEKTRTRLHFGWQPLLSATDGLDSLPLGDRPTASSAP